MGSVEEDEISITSTVESEQESEYEVEAILAEHGFPDGVRYLVQWAGYPLERCTWEPADAFTLNETLLEWGEKKRRITEGKEPAFDVAAWEARLIQLDRERTERRRRRAAKRRKIALSELSRRSDGISSIRKASSHKASHTSTAPASHSNTKVTSLGQIRRPQHGPATRKQPPVLFATSETPAEPIRPKKPPSTDAYKPFNTLSTRWKYEKLKNKEPAPNINQLDLRRPSEWDSVSSTNATQLGSSRLGTVRADATNSPTSTTISSPVLTHITQESPIASPWSNDNSRDKSKPEGNEPFQSHNRVSAPQKDSNILDSECFPDIPPRNPGPYAYLLNIPNRFWNPGEVYVSMYFGPEKHSIGNARLCGLDSHNGDKLKKTKVGKKIEVWFRYLCTLDEYQALCAHTQNTKYSNGWIEGFSDTEPKIRKAAKALQQNNLVAMAQINNTWRDVLLAYPPSSPHFGFLDAVSDGSSERYLNIALRSSLGSLDKLNVVDKSSSGARSSHSQSTEVNNTAKNGSFDSTRVTKPLGNPSVTHDSVRQLPPALPRLDTRQTSSSVASPISSTPFSQASAQTSNSITQGSSYFSSEPMDLDVQDRHAQAMGHGPPPNAAVDLDDVFHKTFGITFDKLATINSTDKPQRAEMFYIWFSEDSELVRTERDLMESFLKKRTDMLYTSRVEGDWEKFVATSKKTNMPCAILFHESFFEYHKIPSLRELLRRSMSCWSVSLSQPLKYLDGSIHLQRLFPHGGIILLTEDFMVREMDGTLVILEWFHGWTQKKFPGSWKMMVRPGVLTWLLERMELSDEPQKHKWLAMYHLLSQLGLSPSDDFVSNIEDDYVKTRVISPPTLPKYGSRTAEESPDIPKDVSQEYRNTDHLAEFFTGWCLLNAHHFRRFVMLTALEPLPRWANWQNLEVKRGSREFLQMFSIDYRAIWAKLKGSRSAWIPDQASYTPRTPKPPSDSSSGAQSASSAPHSQASFKHNYGQPYQ
ncbi:putative Chromo domain protein Chp1p [Aspergillus lucknowensis]|uniref:Chromo domain-containing protein n=1 Tax=Aspergillus lucknowensis TaxID=176173 RepID=A0ABR4LW93_9EURO